MDFKHDMVVVLVVVVDVVVVVVFGVIIANFVVVGDVSVNAVVVGLIHVFNPFNPTANQLFYSISDIACLSQINRFGNSLK